MVSRVCVRARVCMCVLGFLYSVINTPPFSLVRIGISSSTFNFGVFCDEMYMVLPILDFRTVIINDRSDIWFSLIERDVTLHVTV